jgi:hypothetical protein
LQSGGAGLEAAVHPVATMRTMTLKLKRENNNKFSGWAGFAFHGYQKHLSSLSLSLLGESLEIVFLISIRDQSKWDDYLKGRKYLKLPMWKHSKYKTGSHRFDQFGGKYAQVPRFLTRIPFIKLWKMDDRVRR